MRKTLVLAQRELAGYFFSPVAYVIGAMFLCATALRFVPPPFLSGSSRWFILISGNEASLRPLFEWMAYGMVVAIPLLTMRLVSEEYRSGTIETLTTAPVTDAQVIAGKFLGVMGFYLVLLASTGVFLGLLAAYGQIDPGVAVMGYLGMVLLGAAFAAVGVFASALTPYQLVAALIGIAILATFTFLLKSLAYAPEPLNHVAARLNPMTYFKDFSRGVFDTRGLVYFLSATALGLFLSVKTLESKRWR